MNARLFPTLQSPLPGVSGNDWARFVSALDTQEIKAVSGSNGLGAFDLRPRRLVELGYATNLRAVRSPANNRQLYQCDFVAPWTREQFLADPVAQYGVLAHSIADYHEALSRGDIRKPDGMSLAGALAILHRGGAGALSAWPKLFPETQALHDAAQSAFRPDVTNKDETMLNDFDEFSTGVQGESQWDHVEIGNTEIGNTEIGAVEKAFKKVLTKARDNRRPAPRMQAVAVHAPQRDRVQEWALTNVAIGAAEATGNPDPFPLLSGLLLRFGAGGEPRYVRVDTERSYRNFRTESSPEMAELRARVNELSQHLAAHEADPYAHASILANADDLSLLGEAVKRAEAEKRVELWMPKRFDGLWEAWREGDAICASLRFPGVDGQVRICTSLEPVRKCIAEVARHASEAEVPGSTVVGILPAMGCVLGAATVMKELAASAKSILKHPAAAGQRPFVLRLEPQANPALCALIALAQECQHGNQQACEEWQRLSAASPKPIQQLMGEAQQLLQQAA